MIHSQLQHFIFMEKRSRYAVPNPPTWCRHSTGRPTLFLKSATRGRSTSSWKPLLGQAAQLSECSLGSTPLLMGRLPLSGIRFQHSSYLHQLVCFPLSLSFVLSAQIVSQPGMPNIFSPIPWSETFSGAVVVNLCPDREWHGWRVVQRCLAISLMQTSFVIKTESFDQDG